MEFEKFSFVKVLRSHSYFILPNKVLIVAFKNRIWLLLPLLLTSCLITEVIQPDRIGTQEVFNVSIVVVDSLSDPNAWRGTVSIMIPESWEFESGVYGGDVGSGNMELRTKWADQVDSGSISKTDSLRAPDHGMRWLDLVSDSAYSYEGPVTNTISINMRTSADTGRFALGYIVSKDAFPSARDVLGSWQDGSADSLFNQGIEVSLIPTTDLEENYLETQTLSLYPNPSSGRIMVSSDSFGDGSLEPQFDVFDIQGRSVRASVSSNMGSSHVMELDLERLAPGRYLFRLVENGVANNHVLIVQ